MGSGEEGRCSGGEKGGVVLSPFTSIECCKRFSQSHKFDFRGYGRVKFSCANCYSGYNNEIVILLVLPELILIFRCLLLQ